ncbi:hypothetical protein BgiBS90_014913 [Biomphalaria glabrata]|nr:hypothetical protein BgiBS90_014913 [Biomphalaria glabrata]
MKDSLTCSKDDFFLPSICHSVHDLTKSKHASPRKSKSTDESLLPSSRMFNNGKKLYSSAPTSETSTPFKLPSIQRAKSNSVSSLATGNATGTDDDIIDQRADLTRSPSCPSLMDASSHAENLDTQLSPRSLYAKATWRIGAVPAGLKLPNIFQQRDVATASTTSNFSPRVLQTSRDLNMDSPRVMRRQLQMKENAKEPQRSHQNYALLLPLATTSKPPSHLNEGKRKTHKKNGKLGRNDTREVTHILKDRLAQDRLDHTTVQEVEEAVHEFSHD